VSITTLVLPEEINTMDHNGFSIYSRRKKKMLNTLLNDKRVAYALIVVGVVGALLSVLIDPIRGYDIYMSTIQIIVLVVGIVLLLAGLYLAFVRKPPAAAAG
jgi:hypothetical protein